MLHTVLSSIMGSPAHTTRGSLPTGPLQRAAMQMQRASHCSGPRRILRNPGTCVCASNCFRLRTGPFSKEFARSTLGYRDWSNSVDIERLWVVKCMLTISSANFPLSLQIPLLTRAVRKVSRCWFPTAVNRILSRLFHRCPHRCCTVGCFWRRGEFKNFSAMVF